LEKLRKRRFSRCGDLFFVINLATERKEVKEEKR